MTKDQAIRYFRTQAGLCRALGIRPASVSEWKHVPALRQLQLEIITNGKLKADRAIKQPHAA
jgi:hypothetical protein